MQKYSYSCMYIQSLDGQSLSRLSSEFTHCGAGGKVEIHRSNKLIDLAGWYILDNRTDRYRRPTMILSGRKIGDAGPSGISGAPRRQEILGDFLPHTRPSGRFPLISTMQIHSMNILSIELDSEGNRQISLLGAAWKENEYIEHLPVPLFSWNAREFRQNWADLLSIEADGIVTNDPTLHLAVTVADCMPIFATQGDSRALLHSGWAGTGILRRLFGTAGLRRIGARVVLGPCISAQKYQVSQDRAGLFSRRFGLVAAQGRYLDLRAANTALATEIGLERLDIWDSCTVSHSGLFSYRQDGSENYSRMLAVYAAP